MVFCAYSHPNSPSEAAANRMLTREERRCDPPRRSGVTLTKPARATVVSSSPPWHKIELRSPETEQHKDRIESFARKMLAGLSRNLLCLLRFQLLSSENLLLKK